MAVVALAIAIGFAATWWCSAGAMKRFLDDTFGNVFTPAVTAAIVLSAHPDNINPSIYFLALVVQSFAMVFAFLAAIDLVASLLRTR